MCPTKKSLRENAVFIIEKLNAQIFPERDSFRTDAFVPVPVSREAFADLISFWIIFKLAKSSSLRKLI